MKRFLIIAIVVVAIVLLAIVSVLAEAATSSWAFVTDVTAGSGAPGFYNLTLPLDVLDKSRDDLSDLRLFDAYGREVPYALWIRKEVDEQRELSGRIFNQATKGNASEASVDLGAGGVEHNEIQIETGGTNFRRRVEIEGSDTGQDWKSLKTGDVIFGFESQNRSVQSNHVSYPASRFRFLRVRVFADELVDKQPPAITDVRVSSVVREKGQRVNWGLGVPPYQLLRYEGVPASSWTIDLGGRVPCDRLLLEISADSFSRPFQVEAIDDPQSSRLIASGELNRRLGEEKKPLVIVFDREERVRKLRLIVTDYSNQMLPINSITAQAPARQLVFEIKQPANQPLRLFFGNAKATPAHYDFEKDLSARLKTTPLIAEAGITIGNPEFKPEPLPLTERVPWLIYVVLFGSSVALALILLSLARAAMRASPKSSAPSSAQSSP